MYLYMLSWLSLAIQILAITFAIGAGLYYMIDTALACGLLLFEQREKMPLKLVGLCLLCNGLYWHSIRSFPLVELTSPSFLASILLFLFHNYIAFEHFSNSYFEFYQVLCYLTLFCWLIPIVLLVSCSANDNVLPTKFQQQQQQTLSKDESYSDGIVNNYFKKTSSVGRKIGLLSFFRKLNDNYLPTLNGSGSGAKGYRKYY